MSKSNCLYCDCKLGFFKRFGDDRFCSEEHRAEFQKQADLQTIGRLLEAASPTGRYSASGEPLPPSIPLSAWHITNGFPPDLLLPPTNQG